MRPKSCAALFQTFLQEHAAVPDFFARKFQRNVAMLSHKPRGRGVLVPVFSASGQTLKLTTLCREGVEAVLCLLAQDEFERYGVSDLLDSYHADGIDVLHLPTINRTPRSEDALQQAMCWIGKLLAGGRRVLVHCVGWSDRAGTVAGCWLRSCGLSGDEAIGVVRHFRSPRAIETPAQEQAVRNFTAEKSM